MVATNKLGFTLKLPTQYKPDWKCFLNLWDFLKQFQTLWIEKSKKVLKVNKFSLQLLCKFKQALVK